VPTLPTHLCPPLRLLEGDYAEGQTIAVNSGDKGFSFS